MAPRNKVSDVRGLGKLAADATHGLATVVERAHHNVARMPGLRAVAVDASMGGITGLVYRSIRVTTRIVGGGIDLSLGQVAPRVAPEASSPRREAAVAVLNAWLSPPRGGGAGRPPQARFV